TDDHDSLNEIIIKGGSITATGLNSAAIGGGGNGTAKVTIYGGEVTATNNGTGATIGGGGAATGSGGEGIVKIYGGTVTATNNGAGVAIGGGGTNTGPSAGSATVEISGGHVTANSNASSPLGIVIGGGSIGTGQAVGDSAGAATVTITGGTVIANGVRGISGGWNNKNTLYENATVTISGGSYKGNVKGSGTQFTDNNSITYKLTGVTLKNSDDTPVASAAVSKINDDLMGINVVTDSDGKIYLWRADGMTVTSAVANGTQTYGGSVLPGGSGALTRGVDIPIVFYLDKGNVSINADTYSGYDEAGNRFTGDHVTGNDYTVTQTNGDTPNNNTISFTGNNLSATVTLNGIYTNATSSISIPATNNNIKNITLLLADTNRVRSVFYYTGGDSTTSPNTSTLIINNADAASPGTLIANDPAQWQAAIGGTDDDSAVTGLTIAGGNITATGISSAAIGGGGNGYTQISITGGNINATNSGTGATIGGGGGNNQAGGAGNITITGGTVSATNSGGGVAIGGGGSTKSSGSTGTVTISGGHITATVSGTAKNAIGGGNTNNTDNLNSIGGSATVTISGGTIKTGHIGGGHSVENGYAASDFKVTGGSINCTTSAAPTNESVPVYMTRVTLYDNNLPYANCNVGSLDIQGLASDYGLTDVKTDETGTIYIGLPINASAHTATEQGTEKTFTGNVPANGAGVLSTSLQTYYSVRAASSDRYSLWLDPACTSPFTGMASVVQNGVFTFYMKYASAGNAPNAVIAYQSGTGTAMEVLNITPVVSDAVNHIYSYTLSNISHNIEIWFTTTTIANTISRLDLDLAADDIIIKANESNTGNFDVTRGAYTLSNFDGSFYITTGGVNSGYNLTVLSGNPNIYLDKLNLTPAGSGIYIRGGNATLTYSAYDNRIASANAAAITVSSGAVLNMGSALDATGSSLSLTSGGTASAVGGAGEVNIIRTAGYLVMTSPDGINNITAAKYSYRVSGAQTTAPYTYTPSAGTLMGYNDGTQLLALGSLGVNVSTNTYKACTVTFVGYVSTPVANVTSGSLTVPGLSSPPSLQRDGTVLTINTDFSYANGTLTVDADKSFGNITVSEKTVASIAIKTQPLEIVYEHGENLVINDMAVTLTYQGGVTEDIVYANFGDYGITVSPQNGQVLYTEANHNKPVTVTCAGQTANTENLTVKPKVTIVGSREAGYTVSASVAGQAGSGFTWQVENGEGVWEVISGETGQSLYLPGSLTGKNIRVEVSFSGGGIYLGSIMSEVITVSSPTMSFTVPLNAVVTIDASGDCAVTSSSELKVKNYSNVDLYITDVKFAWSETGDNVNAAAIFADYTKVKADLKLPANEDTLAYSFKGATPQIYSPTGTDFKILRKTNADTPGTLALNWEFDIGREQGNYIKALPQSNTELATIIYTIGYIPPPSP
ncbi:MAG: hypothetical protein GX061_07060, partial [Eubacteriaceae bacterium]|nr:hypothetical protein [Eubacteriaceae bacterium]